MPKVTGWELRKLFNDSGLWALSGRRFGRVSRRLSKSRPPVTDSTEFTHSLMWHIYENGVKRAEVHQYQKTDGTCTPPDPKVFIDAEGILFWC